MNRALAAVATLVVLGPATAEAGVETSIGVGPHDAALGGSYVARAGTYAAAFYNPANLAATDATPFEVAIGTVYSQPFVHVESLDGAALQPSREPLSTRGVQFGGRFDVGLVDGLSLGFSAYLPPRAFEFSIRPDDQLQWFSLGDDGRFAANAGAGWRITQWLSVGVGARVGFDIEVITAARVVDIEVVDDPDTGDTTFQTVATFGEQATIQPRVTPLAGISITPWPDTTFGLSYRGRHVVNEWGSTQIDGVPGLPALGYDHYFSHLFEPHRVTVAAAQRVGRWSLSVDLEYARWSDGLTTNRNTLGIGFFGDTLNPSAGVSWTALDGIELLAGYEYSRAPWDNFGGRSNVLSNDEHASSCGMRFDLGEVKLDWALRLRSLVRKTETKDWRGFDSDAQLEANPGFPGYRYGGAVVAGSIGAEAQW